MSIVGDPQRRPCRRRSGRGSRRPRRAADDLVRPGADRAQRRRPGCWRRTRSSPSTATPSGPSPTGMVATDPRHGAAGGAASGRRVARGACGLRSSAAASPPPSTPGRGRAGHGERGGEERRERDEQRHAAAARPAGGAGAPARRRRGGGRAGAGAGAPARRRRGRRRGGGGAARRRPRRRGSPPPRRWRRCRPARRGRALERGPGGPRQVAGRRVPRGGSLAMPCAITASSAAGTPGASARRGRRRVAEVGVHLRQLGVARERHLAGQRVEEHAAERVDVGARVGGLAADLLRRDEVGRADELARARDAARGGGVLGQPEVGQVGVVLRLLGDQHVGRLDVAVHEAAAVRGVERRRDLPDEPHGALGREPALALDELAQVGALHVAHGEVEDAVGLAGLVDGDDVRVVDRGRELRLAT